MKYVCWVSHKVKFINKLRLLSRRTQILSMQSIQSQKPKYKMCVESITKSNLGIRYDFCHSPKIWVYNLFGCNIQNMKFVLGHIYYLDMTGVLGQWQRHIYKFNMTIVEADICVYNLFGHKFKMWNVSYVG